MHVFVYGSPSGSSRTRGRSWQAASLRAYTPPTRPRRASTCRSTVGPSWYLILVLCGSLLTYPDLSFLALIGDPGGEQAAGQVRGPDLAAAEGSAVALFLSFLLLVVFVMPCHAMRLQAIVVWGEAADPALVAKSKVRLFALPSP